MTARGNDGRKVFYNDSDCQSVWGGLAVAPSDIRFYFYGYGLMPNHFPADAVALIARVVERDAPFYDPAISEEAVISLNRFAQSIGHLSGPVAYEQVVALRFRDLWKA